ncbi:hypothetical protein B0H14DRAFT_2632141 [Mycena olivaceomarginata]|nr:hypothetical protein B0H14DRAFT_2632141 [Mycena olivaceomarginata]
MPRGIWAADPSCTRPCPWPGTGMMVIARTRTGDAAGMEVAAYTLGTGPCSRAEGARALRRLRWFPAPLREWPGIRGLQPCRKITETRAVNTVTDPYRQALGDHLIRDGDAVTVRLRLYGFVPLVPQKWDEIPADQAGKAGNGIPWINSLIIDPRSNIRHTQEASAHGRHTGSKFSANVIHGWVKQERRQSIRVESRWWMIEKRAKAFEINSYKQALTQYMAISLKGGGGPPGSGPPAGFSPPIDVAISEEKDDDFMPAEWIGRRSGRMTFPVRSSEHGMVQSGVLSGAIPDGKHTVSELLSRDLPTPSTDVRPATFTNDAVSAQPSFETLFTSVPFISGLASSFNDAWLSGAASIRFPHLPHVRFPLWTEHLLRRVKVFLGKRRRWVRAQDWLAKAGEEVDPDLLSACTDIIEILPWDAPAPGLSPAIHLTTQDLALFLSSEWLNDEMINAGIDYILRGVRTRKSDSDSQLPLHSVAGQFPSPVPVVCPPKLLANREGYPKWERANRLPSPSHQRQPFDPTQG